MHIPQSFGQNACRCSVCGSGAQAVNLIQISQLLKNELVSTLATLQQKHSSLQQAAKDSDSKEVTGTVISQKQTVDIVQQEQASVRRVGADDVLITIWADHRLSSRSEPQAEQNSAVVAESVSTVKRADNESQTLGKEAEEDGTAIEGRSTTKRTRKTTARLSCDVCHRSFGTESTLARHKRRAHRNNGDDHDSLAKDSARNTGSSLQQKGNSAAAKRGDKDVGTVISRRKKSAPRKCSTEDDYDEHRTLTACDNVRSPLASSSHAVRSRLQPRDLGLVARNPSVATSSVVASDAAGSGYDESRSKANENSTRTAMKAGNTEVGFTDSGPEQDPVSKDQSWFQPDSPGSRDLRTLTPHHEMSEMSQFPTPLLTESTDTADEPVLSRLHPETASELLGDKDSSLEHTIFPSLATSTTAFGAEAAESSATSGVNEPIDMGTDSQELTIAFDTGVEPPPSGTDTQQSQQKSCPTSDTKIKRKADSGATISFRHSVTGGEPPKLRRRMAKDTETESENSEKKVSSPSKRKKKSTSRRRSRQTLYERHGEKWRCLECSAVFNTRTGAHGHALTHTEPDGGRCPRCSKTYANAYALRRHRAGCLSGRPPSCPVCGKVVADPAYLAHHVLLHSSGAPKKHQCDRCGLAFAAPARLRDHIAVQHSNAETSHKCDICQREFKLQHHLRRHYRSVHTTEPAVTCDVCGKGFKRADHLHAHMTVHTGARPFVCVQCGRGFTRADTLADHSRLHTGEKPFKCAECGQAFREHRGYKRHLKTKHKPAEGDEVGPLTMSL
ncbi:zinc finger protein 184-like isoform X4 [Amphibalanus amphitrite]|uniref:zinc finger protein 184-like isoform X4 n=2 Tax=Amphibalanus amphitrite TaxID=1232801 RepID=UPI001C927BEC|nr:zinc finger protein 184-like isoform X4 [Amphibalanus amphitrite]